MNSSLRRSVVSDPLSRWCVDSCPSWDQQFLLQQQKQEEGRGATPKKTPLFILYPTAVGFLSYTGEHMWHFDVWLQFHQEEILWQSRRTNIHRRQWITQSGSGLILRSGHNFDSKRNLTRNYLPQPRNLICVWNLCFWRAAVFGDVSTCCWMFRF